MKYKTCTAITENNPKKLAIIVKNTLKKSDFVEIRFDFLKPKDIPITLELVKKQLRRCVCTLRPKIEGGKFQNSENERKSIIKLIAEYNPFLVDVEFNTLQKDKNFQRYMKSSKAKILVSWHNFKNTPNLTILNKKFKDMRKNSDYVKIITMAKTVNDATQTHSVNTILLDENESIIGENTDVFGVQAAYLKEMENTLNKNALVIGAGGVSPSVIL